MGSPTLQDELEQFKLLLRKATRPQLDKALKGSYPLFVSMSLQESVQSPPKAVVSWGVLHLALYQHWDYDIKAFADDIPKYHQRLVAFLNKDIATIRSTLMFAWSDWRGKYSSELQEPMDDLFASGFKFKL